jgi:hypothetical protein
MLDSQINCNEAQSPHWLSLGKIKKFLNYRTSSENGPSSLLDAVENDPQRLKPVWDLLGLAKRHIHHIGGHIYERCSQLGGSFTDIFGIDLLFQKLQQANLSSAVETVSPYLLAGLTEYMLKAPEDFEKQMLVDPAKFAASCIILGYMMSHRITEQVSQNFVVKKVMQQAASIWSLVNLHIMSYQAAYLTSDLFLSPMLEDNFITSETKNCINLLAGILGTGIILPKLMLLMAGSINKHLLKKEHLEGKGTQSSKTAAITNGLTSEVNLALQMDDHLLKQLSDPSRLFQYFIVTLNVLKDVDIPDPALVNPPKKEGWDLVVKKTRNVWLLVAESFMKAKIDLTDRLTDIAKDTEINQQQYTVIRNGVKIENVYRYQLAQKPSYRGI